MRKTISNKDIIRKRLEIVNSRALKQKQVFNQNNKQSEKKVVKVVPINTPNRLSNSQRKRVSLDVKNALNKTTKNRATTIIGSASRFDRSAIRSGLAFKKKVEAHIPYYIEYPPYEKKENVDFDVAICISSYNRYDKVIKILDQLLSNDTKYSFMVFLINDGSTDKRYNNIKKNFPDIRYIENKKNGGKIDYWKTVSNLWGLVKSYETHALCQIDDDFVLCHKFLNILMDRFFEKKEVDNGYMGFRYHLSAFGDDKFTHNDDIQAVDGGTLFDIEFLRKIDYSIPKQKLINEYDSSRIWSFLSEKIRNFGMRISFFDKSLVIHNGNEDSKLNPKIRKLRNINTRKFIDS